jgi:hypothetical protein
MYLSEVDQFTFHANQSSHQYQNVASYRDPQDQAQVIQNITSQMNTSKYNSNMP